MIIQKLPYLRFTLRVSNFELEIATGLILLLVISAIFLKPSEAMAAVM